MAKVVVVYHSGYGHTQKQAEAVAAGANAQLIAIDAEGNIGEADWVSLAAADAIVFGSPTYMGSVSWQFKKFSDASSKPWLGQQWKDKVFKAYIPKRADLARSQLEQPFIMLMDDYDLRTNLRKLVAEILEKLDGN